MDNLADMTIEELKIISFSDITKFATFGAAGIRLKPVAEIDPVELAAVREITSNKGVVSIKLHDKLRALELLGDHIGLFGDFNQAIATLRKYGIFLTQDSQGKWLIEDEPEITDLPQS
ncbi:MAG: terminase small subunit [Hassallia sp. WJT32-NPBG1]|jgi:phage terminase small subunit|nr:terminase small subunit [Hassallia sp. WJT32-NPBG1]